MISRSTLQSFNIFLYLSFHVLQRWFTAIYYLNEYHITSYSLLLLGVLYNALLIRWKNVHILPGLTLYDLFWFRLLFWSVWGVFPHFFKGKFCYSLLMKSLRWFTAWVPSYFGNIDRIEIFKLFAWANRGLNRGLLIFFGQRLLFDWLSVYERSVTSGRFTMLSNDSLIILFGQLIV